MSSKGARTRLRILDVALQELRAHGPARVRMEDVARAAGVSRQALYLHFESRTQLMIALVERLSETVDGAALFAAAATETDVGRRLEEGLKGAMRLMARIHDVALALDVARHTDDAAAAAWEARSKMRRAGLRRTLAAVAEQGRLRPGWTVDHATDALWSIAAPRLYGDLALERRWSQDRIEKLMIELARSFVEPAEGPARRRPRGPRSPVAPRPRASRSGRAHS